MYQMTETEYRFAELIWEEEPIGSGELVKQCAEKFGWKKSTTYTFIKKLCENGIFKNENAIVSSVLNKEEYHRAQGGGFRGEGLRRFAAEDDRRIYPEQEAQRGPDRRDRSYDRGL